MITSLLLLVRCCLRFFHSFSCIATEPSVSTGRTVLDNPNNLVAGSVARREFGGRTSCRRPLGFCGLGNSHHTRCTQFPIGFALTTILLYCGTTGVVDTDWIPHRACSRQTHHDIIFSCRTVAQIGRSYEDSVATAFIGGTLFELTGLSIMNVTSIFIVSRMLSGGSGVF